MTKRTCQKSIAYLQYMYECDLSIDELVPSSMNQKFSIFVNTLFLSSQLYSIKKKKTTRSVFSKKMGNTLLHYQEQRQAMRERTSHVEETVNCTFFLHGFKKSIEPPGAIYFNDACFI